MKKTIVSIPYLELIDWLKEARVNRGWSIRDLAEKLEYPHTTIHRIETLERRLDINEYVVYCRALSLDPLEGLQLFYDL